MIHELKTQDSRLKKGASRLVEAGPGHPFIRLQALGAGRYPLLSLTRNTALDENCNKHEF